MIIFINEKEYHFGGPDLTVAQLADDRKLSPSEAAVDVNDKRVSKIQWHTTHLSEGDRVTIITDQC